jgi:hypothetical protein
VLIFWIIAGIILYFAVLFCGIFVGARMRHDAYHGALHIKESEQGLLFQIELAGDPEMIVFEDSITLKVLPPDYEALIASRGKLGV